MTNTAPAYFNGRNAAAYTSLSMATLYRRVRDGKLRMVKVGFATRFAKVDLDAMMKGNE